MNVRFGKAIYKVGFFVVLAVGVFCVVARARVEAAGGDAAAGPSVPWYRNISTVISVSALAFSFGTTFVSYHRTGMQDIQASRTELRGILQRLSAIPREMLDASKKYAGDPSSITGISQLYNQESTMLSRQAGEIVKRLPKGVVSATEYYAIAVAFQSSYNLAAAKEFLVLATAKANNFNDEIGAIRSSAYLEFLTGQPQAGRVKYQQALNIFAKYPNYDSFTVASTHITTELFWGGSEAVTGQFQLATQHADNAERIVEGLPASLGTDQLRGQIEQARQQFVRAATAGAAGPSAVPTQSWIQHQPPGGSAGGMG
jgi:hypothetical protein